MSVSLPDDLKGPQFITRSPDEHQEKNVLPWSKHRLKQLFRDLTIVSTKECNIKVVSLGSITGDASVAFKKGKPVAYYDLEIKLKWYGHVQLDGKSFEAWGRVLFPKLRDDTPLNSMKMNVLLDTVSHDSAQSIVQVLLKVEKENAIIKRKMMQFLQELRNGGEFAPQTGRKRTSEKDVVIEIKNTSEENVESDESDEEETNNYEFVKKIGSGSTSIVYLAKEKKSGEYVAIKSIKTDFDDLDLDEQVKRAKIIEKELMAMKKLKKHQNVVELKSTFEDGKNMTLNLVLEYVDGGDLCTKIENQDKLDEKSAKRYFSQLIAGVEHLHNHGICHRDLKPENLLIDSKQDVIKISDFGFCGIVKKSRLFDTYCGTENYCAPEILTGKQYDGCLADIWSCGCILYTMLTGMFAFEGNGLAEVIKNVMQLNYTIPSHVSAEAADLIKKILVKEPKRRLSIQQIKEHAWLQLK